MKVLRKFVSLVAASALAVTLFSGTVLVANAEVVNLALNKGITVWNPDNVTADCGITATTLTDGKLGQKDGADYWLLNADKKTSVYVTFSSPISIEEIKLYTDQSTNSKQQRKFKVYYNTSPTPTINVTMNNSNVPAGWTQIIAAADCKDGKNNCYWTQDTKTGDVYDNGYDIYGRTGLSITDVYGICITSTGTGYTPLFAEEVPVVVYELELYGEKSDETEYYLTDNLENVIASAKTAIGETVPDYYDTLSVEHKLLWDTYLNIYQTACDALANCKDKELGTVSGYPTQGELNELIPALSNAVGAIIAARYDTTSLATIVEWAKTYVGETLPEAYSDFADSQKTLWDNYIAMLAVTDEILALGGKPQGTSATYPNQDAVDEFSTGFSTAIDKLGNINLLAGATIIWDESNVVAGGNMTGTTLTDGIINVSDSYYSPANHSASDTEVNIFIILPVATEMTKFVFYSDKVLENYGVQYTTDDPTDKTHAQLSGLNWKAFNTKCRYTKQLSENLYMQSYSANSSTAKDVRAIKLRLMLDSSVSTEIKQYVQENGWAHLFEVEAFAGTVSNNDRMPAVWSSDNLNDDPITQDALVLFTVAYEDVCRPGNRDKTFDYVDINFTITKADKTFSTATIIARNLFTEIAIGDTIVTPESIGGDVGDYIIGFHITGMTKGSTILINSINGVNR